MVSDKEKFLGCFATLGLYTFTFGVTFLLSVFSSIYGWGLTPQSWPTIILCYLIIMLINFSGGFISKVINE